MFFIVLVLAFQNLYYDDYDYDDDDLSWYSNAHMDLFCKKPSENPQFYVNIRN